MQMHRVLVRAGLAVAMLLGLMGQNAFAQFELVGTWANRAFEDVPNDTIPVDFVGLPLNDEARARALSFNQTQITMTERQCEGFPQFYMVQGPFGLKIWSETEPVKGTVTSYTIGAWEDRMAMTIWMDGRPHPSKFAEHTRGGFTTGRWEGNTLVARTTHIKAGHLRKNGPPVSDEATMTTHFYRHGDILTIMMVIDDPVYLTEPHILSRSLPLAAVPMAPVGPPCVSTFEGTTADESVPHYLPEKNPFVAEMTERYHVPKDAVLGMTETLYPEYRKKIRSSFVPLPPCKQNCGAPPQGGPTQ